jgi:hypothetical protein
MVADLVLTNRHTFVLDEWEAIQLFRHMTVDKKEQLRADAGRLANRGCLAESPLLTSSSIIIIVSARCGSGGFSRTGATEPQCQGPSKLLDASMIVARYHDC